MKMRKFAALMLTLCMMLSLSISAFAASDAIASGTIQSSGIRWELDSNGWLTISGSGEAPVFQSADDQPWADYREQITEVWYDDMSTLTISDLAYWFEGCTALTTAELPLAPVIGNHAFYGCDNLNTITMYYGETVLKSIGEDAFWREADAGDTLYIAYIIGYPGGDIQPQGNITRAEVATIFFRLLTDEARETYWSQTNGYTDVAGDAWYNNAISTLSSMGILGGYEDGTFRPDNPITRAEFTKIAVSFFAYADGHFSNPFTDVADNAWYTSFVTAAAGLGLIEGYEDNTFRPDASIVRAEACTIVNRTLGRAPDKDHLLPVEEMITWPDNPPSAWYYAQMQEATNSHDYDWLGDIEAWTEKLEERDWEALEKEWSTAYSAPGGEVMG